MMFAARPVVVGPLLYRSGLARGERVFVMWCGLKGAVPILLGTFIVQTGLSAAPRAYGVIFVVVAFSVIVQGGLVPTLAHRLGVPLRTAEVEPWSLGVRFQDEPEGIHRFTVTRGSPADGATVADLPNGDDIWISFIIRGGRLVTVNAETRLRPGDEVIVLAAAELGPSIARVFTRPRPGAAN
jgi:potassium/hydrogen antiporter